MLNQLTTVNGGARIHDADGNLTDNGEHLYEWDAENRLIEIKLKSDNSIVATYAYDYQSRRITKTVGSTETNFVYNGWNPIAEFTGTTLSKTYTWGMDLSGSMQGAGGVGGLLSVNDGSTTYYPTYDGNGNVSEYVDATGNVVAHYEYDAFGQVVASGAKSGDFTHQFSTKQLDAESGLHYYGYRFYDSSNGRWLGRDPIAERGGVNLYGFVENSGPSAVDYLGMKELTLRYNLIPKKEFHSLMGLIHHRGERATNILVAYEKAKKLVGKYSKTGAGDCSCIKKLTIVTHGYEGVIQTNDIRPEDSDANFELSATTFSTAARTKEKGYKSYKDLPEDSSMFTVCQMRVNQSLQDFNSLLCENGSVEFIGCSSGKGEQGEKLQKHLNDTFKNRNNELSKRLVQIKFGNTYEISETRRLYKGEKQ